MMKKTIGYNNNPNLRAANVNIQYTTEQIKEIARCQSDPVYFIRKYVKIVNIDRGFIPFDLYNFQADLVNTFHTNRKTIAMLGRQLGKSTTCAAYILWSIIFNDTYICAILANKANTAKEILSKVTNAYEALPLWMQQGVVEWNKTSITLENGSRVIAASTSSSAIRGFSCNLIMLDEFAFIHPNMADDFFTSVYPTISSGTTSKTIIISTPNGYNHFYRLWNEAVQNRNGFIHKIYTWRDHPERDQAWAEDQKRVLGDLKYSQEIEVEFLGSSNTLVNANAIRNMSATKPLFYTDSLFVYEEAKPKHNYILVADTSRGKELDYSAFIVFDVTTYPIRIVAKFRDNTISPQLYPGIIYKIGKKYNDAQILVEVNDNGQEVANILHNDFEYDNMISTSFHSREVGIRTDKKVKRLGCTILKDLVETQKLIVNDIDLIAEFSTFVQHKESYAASVGAHDDLVMCCVLLAWFSSTNLFKDIFDMDIRKKLHEELMKSIEDDVLPFGIIDTGIEDNADEYL